MIEKGVASELLLLAFLKPDSGYRLAQRLQNTSDTPDTSKIYKILNLLKDEQYLIKRQNKYHHNPDRIIPDISSHLLKQNYQFTREELKIMRDLLSNGHFYNIISLDTDEKMKNQPKGIHEINAIEFFCEKIGMLACLYQHFKQNKSSIKGTVFESHSTGTPRKSVEKFSEELEEMTKAINGGMETKINGSKSIRKNKMSYIELLSETMKSMLLIGYIFEKIPEETLNKLCKLWNQHEGFMLGVTFSNVDYSALLQIYNR